MSVFTRESDRYVCWSDRACSLDCADVSGFLTSAPVQLGSNRQMSAVTSPLHFCARFSSWCFVPLGFARHLLDFSCLQLSCIVCLFFVCAAPSVVFRVRSESLRDVLALLPCLRRVCLEALPDPCVAGGHVLGR
jgi:hypothetical protein